MKKPSRFLLPALAVCLVAAALGSCATTPRETGVTVRFYPEAIAGDINTYPDPIILTDPDRKIYRSKKPSISETDIESIFPYQVADGSVGCVFMLDDRGKAALDALSVEKRGSTLTAMVNNRMIINMLIDRHISDGIIVIPHGMTIQEGLLLKKTFKSIKAPPNPTPGPTPPVAQ